ncbi:GGDEF domain-containing protein [Rhizobium halophilum]|uniref:GGDEF domain-containing protein n=1 Tax=Rhizobium halophilum TaxID=2846852 RepID=UPI001EFC2F42|nr:GGDEF domain-containing protein [Rhizobium halophilum]MCF6371305.1 GGDEF domain-containing protein [Rhizobium halophilum]
MTKLMTIFGRLSLILQTCWVVAVAVVGADLLTLIFYGIFFTDRLLLDLVLTTIITLLVGFPIAYFFLGQQLKLAKMAVRLEQSARTDHLTGLGNRAAFFPDVSSLLDLSGACGALLYIDADHFKSVNDAFGHATGDAVLKSIAKTISEVIREGDVAARIGGEEFVVFLAGATPQKAAEVAERIRFRVLQTVARAAGLLDRSITVSIGISISSGGCSVEQLMSRADKNLYRAKELGRNRIIADEAPDGRTAA